MRRSEDVPSDELASFYSLLSHDGKENLSVKHFNVLGWLASELCQSNKEITSSCMCVALGWIIATSSFQSGLISSVSCMRKIFLWGSLWRFCSKARKVLRRSAWKCLQKLQRKTATGSSASSLKNFEKFGIIEDSTDWTEIAELLRFNISMPGVELISFEEVRSLSEEGFERHALHHWWEHRRLVVSPVRGYAALEGFCAWWTPWMNMPFNSSRNSMERRWSSRRRKLGLGGEDKKKNVEEMTAEFEPLTRFLETRLGWEGDREWLGRGLSVLCDDESNTKHIMEAHELRDSSMCSRVVSKNTVEDNPTLSPMMSPMMELKKNGICRQSWTDRASHFGRQYCSEPAPFTGRSCRMIKLGSRMDDDDDDESLGDDDFPPLEQVVENYGRDSEDAGGRRNLVRHSSPENSERTVFNMCDALWGVQTRRWQARSVSGKYWDMYVDECVWFWIVKGAARMARLAQSFSTFQGFQYIFRRLTFETWRLKTCRERSLMYTATDRCGSGLFASESACWSHRPNVREESWVSASGGAVAFLPFPESVTSKRSIALLPALVRWWKWLSLPPVSGKKVNWFLGCLYEVRCWKYGSCFVWRVRLKGFFWLVGLSGR